MSVTNASGCDEAYSALSFEPTLITDVFIAHSGSGAAKKERGAIPYVAASFQNNGIVGYVDKPKYKGGWLSLVKDGDGGAGKCRLLSTSPILALKSCARS